MRLQVPPFTRTEARVSELLEIVGNPEAAADLRPTVGLPFVMRELGARNMGLPRQITYAELLIAECGFPPPLPCLVGKKGAQTLTRAVVRDSQWRRAPVEAWIFDQLPPASAAALDARAQAAAAHEMDAAAGGLKLFAGGER